MDVTVLLFSMLREKTGYSSMHLSLPEDATTTELVHVLADKYPALGPYLPHVRLAVNQEYVTGTVRLSRGDEVALIPPVSGG